MTEANRMKLGQHLEEALKEAGFGKRSIRRVLVALRGPRRQPFLRGIPREVRKAILKSFNKDNMDVIGLKRTKDGIKVIPAGSIQVKKRQSPFSDPDVFAKALKTRMANAAKRRTTPAAKTRRHPNGLERSSSRWGERASVGA